MTDDREKAGPVAAEEAARAAFTAGRLLEVRQRAESEGQQTPVAAKTQMTREEGALWDLDFGVKKSMRYHAWRRAHYERLENWINGLVAITGASAFAVLLGGDSKWGTGITAAVALIALLAVIWGFGRKAREHQDLYRRFSELAIKIAISDHPSEREIARLNAERLSLEAEEPHTIDALERHCWNEEAESRGFAGNTLQPMSRFQRLRVKLA